MTISKTTTSTEQASSKNNNGVYVRFMGQKILSDGRVDNTHTPSDRSKWLTTFSGSTTTQEQFTNFIAMAALVMRYNLGHRQRAGLIDITSRRDKVFKEADIESIAEGGNKSEIIPPHSAENSTYQDTLFLAQSVYNISGRSKVMSERGQRTKDINTKDLRGENKLWDTIHQAVWKTGINLQYNLSKQGFKILQCPQEVDEITHQKITDALSQNKFTQDDNRNSVIVHLDDTSIELFYKDFKKITIEPDTSALKSAAQLTVLDKEDNNSRSSLGWVMSPTKTVLDNNDAQDLARIIAISKAGFFSLTKDEQKIIMSGRLSSSSLITFQQNAAFNAMSTLLPAIEEKHGFSTENFMTDNLKSTMKNLSVLFEKDPNLMDKFLIGDLLNEMFQPIRQTAAFQNSGFTPRLKSSFSETHNISKAMAFALGFKKDGKPVIAEPQGQLEIPPHLMDVEVPGTLMKPSLNNPKDTNSLLSASILVNTQLVIDVIVRQAKDNAPEAIKFLEETLGKADTENLMGIASRIPSERIGVQFEESDSLTQFVRDNLGMSPFVTHVREERNNKDLQALSNDFRKLVNLSKKLQDYTSTSGEPHTSRGALAGLEPIARQFFPKIAKDSFPSEQNENKSLYETLQDELSKRGTQKAIMGTLSAVVALYALYKKVGG